MMGHAQVVSSLIELIEDKSDLDIEDTIGKTALHWAGIEYAIEFSLMCF